jgi:hypothetical protein
VLLPTEESLHASVCSGAAFVCLACVLVPELRHDWKLAAPLLALAGSGPGAAAALAGVATWEGLQELPPEESLWQWLGRRLAALPMAMLGGAAQQARAAALQAWRTLTGERSACALDYSTYTKCVEIHAKPCISVALLHSSASP